MNFFKKISALAVLSVFTIFSTMLPMQQQHLSVAISDQQVKGFIDKSIGFNLGGKWQDLVEKHGLECGSDSPPSQVFVKDVNMLAEAIKKGSFGFEELMVPQVKDLFENIKTREDLNLVIKTTNNLKFVIDTLKNIKNSEDIVSCIKSIIYKRFQFNAISVDKTDMFSEPLCPILLYVQPKNQTEKEQQDLDSITDEVVKSLKDQAVKLEENDCQMNPKQKKYLGGFLKALPFLAFATPFIQKAFGSSNSNNTKNTENNDPFVLPEQFDVCHEKAQGRSICYSVEDNERITGCVVDKTFGNLLSCAYFDLDWGDLTNGGDPAGLSCQVNKQSREAECVKVEKDSIAIDATPSFEFSQELLTYIKDWGDDFYEFLKLYLGVLGDYQELKIDFFPKLHSIGDQLKKKISLEEFSTPLFLANIFVPGASILLPSNSSETAPVRFTIGLFFSKIRKFSNTYFRSEKEQVREFAKSLLSISEEEIREIPDSFIAAILGHEFGHLKRFKLDGYNNKSDETKRKELADLLLLENVSYLKACGKLNEEVYADIISALVTQKPLSSVVMFLKLTGANYYSFVKNVSYVQKAELYKALRDLPKQGFFFNTKHCDKILRLWFNPLLMKIFGRTFGFLLFALIMSSDLGLGKSLNHYFGDGRIKAFKIFCRKNLIFLVISYVVFFLKKSTCDDYAIKHPFVLDRTLVMLNLNAKLEALNQFLSKAISS